MTDLQYRNVNHEINGTRKFPTLTVDKTFHFFNPKAGIHYDGNLIDGYISYAIANKEPNRTDFETAGDIQQPKREQLHDLEAGIEHQGSQNKYGATIYYMRYKDQLVLTGKLNDVGDAIRINVPDSYRLGLELWGGREINPWLSFEGNISVSKNQLQNYIDYLPLYDAVFDFLGYDTLQFNNTPISFSPAITAFGSIRTKPFKNLELSLTGKGVGKQYLDNTGSEQKKLDGYFVQDIQIRYSLSRNIIKSADLVIQANNIWNKRYQTNGYTYSYAFDKTLVKENFYYPMAGTNWMVGLNIKL
jgi:iron complex outermembrane receptor protein